MKQEPNLQWAKEFLESKGHIVHYVAVYGSQNYNLDTENSDVDYKAIIIPTLDQIIANSKPFSTSYEFDGWLIDCKDIRAYVESAVKCNINFIEILNTDLYIGDNTIQRFFFPLQEQLGQLFLRACYGMMLEKVEALRHPYPSTISKIEKFWYDPKQLHHILRLKILMQRFSEWDIGRYWHIGDEREKLIRVKEWMIKNDMVDSIVADKVEYAKYIRDEYISPMRFEVKEEMIDWSRQVIKDYILHYKKTWQPQP